MALVQALIAGTQKHFSNGTITFGNTAYTAATLVQMLEDLANALTALSAAHVRLKDAGLTLQGVGSKVNPVIRDYRRFVQATFSTAPQQLADFGLQAHKAPKPLTTEKRAAATAKMRATRKARGTTSKKQKLGVKGDVTSVTITPVTAPTASAPTATPAEPPAVHASASTTK